MIKEVPERFWVKLKGGETMDKKALKEAIKEPLRILTLSILPFAIAYVVALPYSWAIIITLLLRWIDAYLHELAPKGEAGGLVRF